MNFVWLESLFAAVRYVTRTHVVHSIHTEKERTNATHGFALGGGGTLFLSLDDGRPTSHVSSDTACCVHLYVHDSVLTRIFTYICKYIPCANGALRVRKQNWGVC